MAEMRVVDLDRPSSDLVNLLAKFTTINRV